MLLFKRIWLNNDVDNYEDKMMMMRILLIPIAFTLDKGYILYKIKLFIL